MTAATGVTALISASMLSADGGRQNGHLGSYPTTKLGLQLEFEYPDFYAGIRAGSRVFHLKLVDEKDPSIRFVEDGEHFHLYLATTDVAATAAALT